MNKNDNLSEFQRYIELLESFLSKFVEGGSMYGLFLKSEDEAQLKRVVIEVIDFLKEIFGESNTYSLNIINTINTPTMGGGPSLASVQEVIGIMQAATTAYKRKGKIKTNHMMDSSIEEVKKKRFQFLHRLYEITGGDKYHHVNMWELGDELGFDRDETKKISQYLKGEYLLEFGTLDGGINITHEGVKEIEDAFSHPEEPTQYFPSVNIINIHHMEGSQIQQGSTQSTHTQSSDSEQQRSRSISPLTIAIVGGLVVAAVAIFIFTPVSDIIFKRNKVDANTSEKQIIEIPAEHKGNKYKSSNTVSKKTEPYFEIREGIIHHIIDGKEKQWFNSIFSYTEVQISKFNKKLAVLYKNSDNNYYIKVVNPDGTNNQDWKIETYSAYPQSPRNLTWVGENKLRIFLSSINHPFEIESFKLEVD